MTKSICTIFTDSHLPQALTLWESVRTRSTAWDFIALRIGSGDLATSVPEEFRQCCLDASALPGIHPGARFWYEPFEFCNCVRAPLHRYLWSKREVGEWWYVDADCQFTDDPDRLTEQWRHASILLSAHRRTHAGGSRSGDIRFLFHGIVNSGLLGIRRSPASSGFLDWFSERLTWLSFSEPNLGLFVDQKWLDLAPNYFPCDWIEDAGINVGYWNYSDDHATGKIPVRLLHFSQVALDGERAAVRTDHTMDETAAASFLRHVEHYRNRMRHWAGVAGAPPAYPYGTFLNGRPITKVMRRAYYCDVLDGQAPPDPFLEGPRYEKADPRRTMQRFVDRIYPYAARTASELFPSRPSLAELRDLFGAEDLMGLVPARVALRALRQRARRRLAGLFPGRKD